MEGGRDGKTNVFDAFPNKNIFIAACDNNSTVILTKWKWIGLRPVLKLVQLVYLQCTGLMGV